ncbi:hypothetical protein [Allorhodopirellula solitaria]|nr:hypothetical protein [Allorhodopirellula solitaria]
MSSHAHLVLRSRPDVVAAWSDDEVARRWLRLLPKRRNQDGGPAEPTIPELDMIRNCPEVLASCRLTQIDTWQATLSYPTRAVHLGSNQSGVADVLGKRATASLAAIDARLGDAIMLDWPACLRGRKLPRSCRSRLCSQKIACNVTTHPAKKGIKWDSAP